MNESEVYELREKEFEKRQWWRVFYVGESWMRLRFVRFVPSRRPGKALQGTAATRARLQSLESVEMRNGALAQIMPGTAYEHAKTYSRVSTRDRHGAAN